ncbi:MAG: glycosyltransferase [Clostridiales bacterium]|nr:glycosyltransferase [Clostridiales bacterium]
MKKKIIIANNNLHIGGIQKALVNLLWEIKDIYDVTLYLSCFTGELCGEIPEDIKIITGNRYTQIMGMEFSEAKKAGFFPFLLRFVCTVITKIFGFDKVFRFLSKRQKLEEKYDYAVSFMQNSNGHYFYGGINYIVLNSIDADKKISFVHCDFEHYDGNNRINREQYNEFDEIACVSDGVARNFLHAVPGVKDKVHTVYNCYNIDKIKELAQEEVPEKFGKDRVNIFSAARISPEKGISRMIPVLKKLKDDGFLFSWYVAGKKGADYEKTMSLIKENGLEDRVFLLGSKINPYPYFKMADLVLVPSYNEAAPMVFGEAEILGTKVLSTDTSSAKELVEDKNIGFVCKNSEKALYEKLKYLLENKELLSHYERDFSNEKAKAQFDILVNG